MCNIGFDDLLDGITDFRVTREIVPQVSTRWQVRLQGRLTPPVVAGERLYVAAKDRHTLHALRADDGRKLWQFTAAGMIDSPPTVHGRLVLFGSAEGCVPTRAMNDEGKLSLSCSATITSL